jgi:hypothetical protein
MANNKAAKDTAVRDKMIAQSDLIPIAVSTAAFTGLKTNAYFVNGLIAMKNKVLWVRAML